MRAAVPKNPVVRKERGKKKGDERAHSLRVLLQRLGGVLRGPN